MSLMSSAQLNRLKNHKYSSDNASIIDPYLQPWWNWVVSLVPMWVAPNLITIVGLVINILTSIIFILHAPQAKEEVAWWIPLSCGLGLFIYQTLDAIDGKQARRTGNSNALGELFDHGCDSMSTVFVALAGCCMLGLGELPFVMLYQSFAASILFYVAHWQTYVSGKMCFGKFDVTEAQFSMIALMFITSLMGTGFWSQQIFGVLTLRWVPVIFATCAALYGMPLTVNKILFGGAGRNGSTVAGTSVIAPIVPVMLIAFPGWYIAVHSDIYVNQPVLFNLLFGIIGCKVTNKLIVAQMTRSEMTSFDLSMLVPWVMFLYIFWQMNYLPQSLILWGGVIFATIDLLWYCKNICLDICNGCGWYLFKINKLQGQNGSQSASSSSSSSTSTGEHGMQTRRRR